QARADNARFNADVETSDETLKSLRSSAERAKDAVAQLHAEMNERRAKTPNDPTVQDYFANQAKYDKALERREDPGDFRVKRPRKPRVQSMGTEWTDELRAAELAAVQQGQTSADQLAQVEIGFWAKKVTEAKKGSADYKRAVAGEEGAESSAVKQAAEEKRAIAEDDATTQLAIEKAGIEQRKAAIEANYDAGLIDAEQKRDLLATLAKEEAQDEIDALEAKKRAYAGDVVAVAQAANQEKVVWANLAAEQARLDRQYTQDHVREVEKRQEADRKGAEEQ